MRTAIRPILAAAATLVLTSSVAVVDSTAAQAASARPVVTSVASHLPEAGSEYGGDRITIHGRGFTRVKAVRFGTAPGTAMKVLSSTEIQVTSPAHKPGIVFTHVITSAGSSASTVLAWFVFVPAPLVTSVSPGGGSWAGGTRVTIHGTDLRDAVGVEFGDREGTALRVLSATELQVTTPVAQYTGSVHVVVQGAQFHSPRRTADRFVVVVPPVVSSMAPLYTQPGTRPRLTILGQHFSGATRVTFGGVPGTSLEVDSSTELHVTAPAHASAIVPVVVAGRYAASSPDAASSFAYLGRPTISDVSWAASPATGTTGVTITGTDFVPGATVMFGDTPATGVTDQTLTTLTADAPAHAPGVVDVTVTTPDGTSATSARDRFDYTAPNPANWSTQRSFDSAGGAIRSISCPSANFCAAIDNRSVTTYSGGGWGTPQVIDVWGGLKSVSCASATFCLAVGQSGETSQFNGSTWTAASTAISGLLNVSCPTSTFCLATGGSGLSYTFDGSTWTAAGSVGATVIRSVSCASPTFCVAVGPTAYTFDGATWTSPGPVDPGDGGLVSVSCPSPSSCTALDEFGSAVRWDGHAWSSPTVAAGNSSLRAVSCGSDGSCAAVGLYTATTFDGATWSAPATVDAAPDQMETVACASLTFCVAGDDFGQLVTFTGSGWGSPQTIINPSGAQNAVSCASPTFCISADSDGNATEFDGTKWLTPVPVLRTRNSWDSVSCPTASFCAMTGNPSTGTVLTGVVSTFDGTTWTAPVVSGLGSRIPNLVSCVSASFCVAADSLGHSIVYNGRSWSKAAVAAGLAAVTCVSATFCVAVGSAGVTIFNGHAWTAPTRVGLRDTWNALSSVTCTDSSDCIAGDSVGDVFTFDGKAWDGPTATGLAEVDALSCAPASSCVALNANSYASGVSVRHDGLWTDAYSLPGQAGAAGARALSCTGAGFCLAVGAQDSFQLEPVP